jgi:hypothetical protein
MINAEIIQAIKAEIERLKGQLIRGACAAQIEMETNCKDEAYNELLSFLSTLESEKPLPNDLEEAAGEYEKKHTYQRYDGGGLTPECDVTLAEAFIAGYNLCKEQMLKDAVEAKIYGYDDGSFELIASWLDMPNNSIYKDGDKVKIIIVKEGEK